MMIDGHEGNQESEQMATAASPVNVRALRNEADWLPGSLQDVVIVRQTLAGAGQPDQVVNGIVGWLVAKSAGQRDNITDQTRSRYRKVLAELQSPLPPNRGGAIPRLLNSDIDVAA